MNRSPQKGIKAVRSRYSAIWSGVELPMKTTRVLLVASTSARGASAWTFSKLKQTAHSACTFNLKQISSAQSTCTFNLKQISSACAWTFNKLKQTAHSACTFNLKQISLAQSTCTFNLKQISSVSAWTFNKLKQTQHRVHAPLI